MVLPYRCNMVMLAIEAASFKTLLFLESCVSARLEYPTATPVNKSDSTRLTFIEYHIP
jgi:hypothetical protein